MAERKTKGAVTRSQKVKDPRAIKRFLEELSWLLESHSNLDFRALGENIEFIGDTERNFSRHVPKNPNIRFLVGILPAIFSNEHYFPTNEDLKDFSSEALSLPVSRWEKRSRYELIGLIVCETVKLNDDRLARLVAALSRITTDDPNAQEILQSRKAQKLSWNEVIQKLTHGG